MYKTNILNLNEATIRALKWKEVPVENLYDHVVPYRIIATEPKENGIMLYLHEGMVGTNVRIVILDYTVLKSGKGEARIAEIVWMHGDEYVSKEAFDKELKEYNREDAKIRKQFEE